MPIRYQGKDRPDRWWKRAGLVAVVAPVYAVDGLLVWTRQPTMVAAGLASATAIVVAAILRRRR